MRTYPFTQIGLEYAPGLTLYQWHREYAPKQSKRKLRLLAVACANLALPLVHDDRQLAVLRFADDYADGFGDDGQRRELRRLADAAMERDERGTSRLNGGALELGYVVLDTLHEDALDAVELVTTHLRRVIPPRTFDTTMPILLADIFGHPLEPISFESAWRTSSAVALARTMYDSRAFDRMPILADALEEAGCEVPAVLDHCRDPAGVHVRGCWVVDGVLGKT